MLGAVTAFTVMLGCVKGAGDDALPLELVFWRGTLGALGMLPMMWGRSLRVTQVRVLVLRVAFGTAAMGCFYTATMALDLAVVSVIQRLQPLAIALAAPLVLGREERPSGTVWLALGLGMAGSVVLLAPQLTSGSWWGLWAVAAALLSAAAHITLRALGRTEDPRVVVFWFQLGAAVAAYVGASLQLGHPLGLPVPRVWPYAVAIAVCATVGQLLMTRAYQADKAAAVSATSYSAPVLAAVLDLVVFGVAPAGATWLGGVLVVWSGLTLVTGTPSPRGWWGALTTRAR
jgi:drug/metabolite transporter (DMT)-like permease